MHRNVLTGGASLIDFVVLLTEHYMLSEESFMSTS